MIPCIEEENLDIYMPFILKEVKKNGGYIAAENWEGIKRGIWQFTQRLGMQKNHESFVFHYGEFCLEIICFGGFGITLR